MRKRWHWEKRRLWNKKREREEGMPEGRITKRKKEMERGQEGEG